ncbi:MAG: M1 family aminopeptidase [Polyangiaceae bacterium]
MRKLCTCLALGAGLFVVACGSDNDDPNGAGASGTGAASSSSSGSGASAGSGATSSGGGGSGASSSGGEGGGGAPVVNPDASEDWTRDLLSTGLDLNLTTLAGKATITIAGSDTSTGASFEVGDLVITKLTNDIGDVHFTVTDGQMDIGIPAGGDQTVVVEYTFASHVGSFDGWDATAGVSFLWPKFCGNLFPCKSDPSDGLTFTATIQGEPAGQTLVYPASIPADAPSYQFALASGEFTKLDLGTTTAGTQVSAWHLPGQEAVAEQGTLSLRDVFDFYEQTYGVYSFGGEVGSVSADWGDGDYGGMEHHPYWHVARGSFQYEDVHAHEAAHGWYGDGVRIACWEDFVLSEGTATYLAAVSLGVTGVDLWADYDCALAKICAAGGKTVALPDATCNDIDIITHPLWSLVPYQKGAQFYREVEDILGFQAIDEVLASFYADHANGTARMQQMIDALQAKGTPDQAAAIDAVATAWLRTEACPANAPPLCD